LMFVCMQLSHPDSLWPPTLWLRNWAEDRARIDTVTSSHIPQINLGMYIHSGHFCGQCLVFGPCFSPCLSKPIRSWVITAELYVKSYIVTNSLPTTSNDSVVRKITGTNSLVCFT
jgi:hypothetical protein